MLHQDLRHLISNKNPKFGLNCLSGFKVLELGIIEPTNLSLWWKMIQELVALNRSNTKESSTYNTMVQTWFSWSHLGSNKTVKENQDRVWFRDGPRCPKQVSVKSGLLLPLTKFSKVCVFQRLSTSRHFWWIFRGQISFMCSKVFSRIYWRF
jgi:hypothetical protein